MAIDIHSRGGQKKVHEPFLPAALRLGNFLLGLLLAVSAAVAVVVPGVGSADG